MPHIVFNKNQPLSTPSQTNGVDFKFIAKSFSHDKSRRTEYKIGVENDHKAFLLTLKDKNENLMIKADKVTRVTPVDLVKEALNAYVNTTQSDVVFSNTNTFSQKVEPQKEYLKDIDYFVNEFDCDKEIWIEVGFGSGRHLLHQAALNPHIQFIGLEIHTPSIEQLLKQINIQNLDNILAVNYDARLFMEFIKSNKVGKIFVHFPVPWDKKPHRRVYSNEFINEALRVLKIGGTLELRTDSRKYFDYCTELLTNLREGRITIDINKDLQVTSKYEDRWKKQGKNIYDVVLECHNEDEEINHDFEFEFDKEVDFETIKSKLNTKPLVEDGFFIHMQDLYEIEGKENSGLIHLTFGSFDRPLSKYLMISQGKVNYYQGKPIPTSANIKAHKKLKELL